MRGSMADSVTDNQVAALPDSAHKNASPSSMQHCPEKIEESLVCNSGLECTEEAPSRTIPRKTFDLVEVLTRESFELCKKSGLERAKIKPLDVSASLTTLDPANNP